MVVPARSERSSCAPGIKTQACQPLHAVGSIKSRYKQARRKSMLRCKRLPIKLVRNQNIVAEAFDRKIFFIGIDFQPIEFSVIRALCPNVRGIGIQPAIGKQIIETYTSPDHVAYSARRFCWRKRPASALMNGLNTIFGKSQQIGKFKHFWPR